LTKIASNFIANLWQQLMMNPERHYLQIAGHKAKLILTKLVLDPLI